MKTCPVNLDSDVYDLLKAEQKRRGNVPLRQVAHALIREGVTRRRKYGQFDAELVKHLRSVSDQSFLGYLNSPFIGDLIRLLDDTRPTYKDIAIMSALITFWGISSREFFTTLVTYAKYGLSLMKGEE